jgi:hypothetical protein
MRGPLLITPKIEGPDQVTGPLDIAGKLPAKVSSGGEICQHISGISFGFDHLARPDRRLILVRVFGRFFGPLTRPRDVLIVAVAPSSRAFLAGVWTRRMTRISPGSCSTAISLLRARCLRRRDPSHHEGGLQGSNRATRRFRHASRVDFQSHLARAAGSHASRCRQLQ